MTATYNANLLTYLDYVRLVLGDTDTAAPMTQDEEIAALLIAVGYFETIAILADSLAVRYAQRPDVSKQSNEFEQRWTSRVKTWLDLAKRARAGGLVDPFITAPGDSLISVEQTTIQVSTPGTALPTSVPEGVLGGYRSE